MEHTKKSPPEKRIYREGSGKTVKKAHSSMKPSDIAALFKTWGRPSYGR